jgi:HSP20 family protein
MGESSGTGYKSVLDNVFSSQRPVFSLSEKVWNPPADVYETRDSLVIKMEIPGVDREGLETVVEGNCIVVRGCRREMSSLPKEDYHLMEIRYGRFERVFGLPVKVRVEEIEAHYNNGFLVVTVPKKPTVARDIPITEGE